ncbi:mediator of RNA polymerase II transcription subunit 25 isoform X6 [Megalopta genalis]|uniref:mediator of RNA polymerase II transcription subunit 25 isoform X6 n=1 Tax=Megalopta genalis TaxID=115081 RepID=UPI003FD5C073
MVAGPTEHGTQADVIFVIEGTAVNGAYLNDLRTNYVGPTLEYFNQGPIEDREYVSENSSTLYGIVIYHAADCLPAPCTETFGPYANPHKLQLVLDKLEMVGGKGESYANIGEGLATGLQCFEDLQLRREPNTASQKHCILICNSPPYQTVIQESYKFAGHTIEQVATLYQERNINLSILSPRKIPALFKMFEKAGGDLQSSQTKNYAKDPRHLVLLCNYNLKERPVSPPIGGAVHNNLGTAAQIPLSPLQSNDSPNTNQVQQNIAQPTQSQGPPFRNQTPQNIAPVHQTVVPIPTVMSTGRPPYNPQISAPPTYHPPAQTRTGPRWRPFVTLGNTGAANPQSSALIAQLNQPPSLGLNVTPFGQRMDVLHSTHMLHALSVANTNVMAANAQQQQQQQQQLTQQQHQQVRFTMQLQQQQQQQQNVQQQSSMPMSAQQNHGQGTPQLTVSCVSQSVPTQVPQTVTTSQIQASVSSVTQQQQVLHSQAQGNISSGPVAGPQISAPRERHTIWHGMIEWVEKAKASADTQKQIRHLPCHVSANSEDGDPELKADTWPQKLLMQLMPRRLISSIGGSYLTNSKSVLFHPAQCEALESLTKVMSSGFAGPAQGNAITGPMPTTGTSQGGILMSQTNTMAMGGGQITQNVVPTNAAQQTLTSSVGPQSQISMQQTGQITGPQVAQPSGTMIGQQRPPFDDLEIARRQNLLKIQHLRQTLEAAQQQEAQYKSQLEVNIQQNLEVAQQQEMQYKQQLEAQQAQRALNPVGMANQQANAPRLMRPGSNMGLRHLLQQPQPPYRQVLGLQQQIVAARGQMPTRPMAPGNSQNQQFEDVNNYDFLR